MKWNFFKLYKKQLLALVAGVCIVHILWIGGVAPAAVRHVALASHLRGSVAPSIHEAAAAGPQTDGTDAFKVHAAAVDLGQGEAGTQVSEAAEISEDSSAAQPLSDLSDAPVEMPVPSAAQKSSDQSLDATTTFYIGGPSPPTPPHADVSLSPQDAALASLGITAETLERGAAVEREQGALLEEATASGAVTNEELTAEEEQAAEEGEHRAVLVPSEELSHSSDQCGQALGVKKVAIMLLTMGDLYHHKLWQAWFRSVEGKLPWDAARRLQCDSRGDGEGQGRSQLLAICRQHLQDLPPAGEDGAGVIARQQLFNVYVHAPPDINDEDLPPMFRGHLIDRRIKPQWGTHQLVEATRYLMWAAYRDPLNQRFVLASESDVPIVHPALFYEQMMGESLARINTCVGPRNDRRRWSWRMATPELRPTHWRKSGQWFMLTRRHVAAVLGDVRVFRKFERYCVPGWDHDYRRYRDCFSDEHYFATLFTVLGMEQKEMNCEVWGIVSTDWSLGGAHPRAYQVEDVSVELVETKLRAPLAHCDTKRAQEQAVRRFVALEDALASADVCARPVPAFEPMAPVCKLTARKFPKETAEALHALFTTCGTQLRIVDEAQCWDRPQFTLTQQIIDSFKDMEEAIVGQDQS
ncbi:beta-1,6-N-acetylglucosaminyltransferase enzyme [Helicosporidium sp. ATCC 50920]|nr:beta-1,6-N-acetylglucosaminyltransferase enzyme [Helicosporidium sp. ATCC 50920]|eukprot:KDD76804.1 beta-1,6-N-acetylglucosaminyltransferase enzyme [Helicosporidium sp. ATCC 50920]